MSVSVKSFGRWSLLIFALLLLALSGCTAENSDDAVKMEAVEDAVSEENSSLDDNRDVLSVSEGTTKGLDTTPLVTQTDQQVVISTNWLDENWRKNFEVDENCQADNNDLRQINFSDSSICALQNFKLFFDRFSQDANFQISVIKFPLRLIDISPDYSNGNEIEEITCVHLPQKQKVSPLFPIREQREYVKYKFSYNVEGSVATVHLGIEDTGFSKEYIFIWDQCWVLSEIRDYSI